MTQTIALYGGSFNPPTQAHHAIGVALCENLPIDAVWFLVSPQNPFKSANDMADFSDRVAMTRLNNGHDARLITQDIEGVYAHSKLNGVIETTETLRLLSRDFPDTRFIWVMGADNFAHFHKWGSYDFIAQNYPIAVIPRHDYTDQALSSPSAQRFPRRHTTQDMLNGKGWFMLDMPESNITATLCRAALEVGQRPEAMRPAVLDYISARGLYRSSPRCGNS